MKKIKSIKKYRKALEKILDRLIIIEEISEKVLEEVKKIKIIMIATDSDSKICFRCHGVGMYRFLNYAGSSILKDCDFCSTTGFLKINKRR